MARTVIVHVGAPKTGTSFVQDLLFNTRDELARRGILYPAARFDAHFLAALDLMQLTWGGLEREAVGAWDRLAAEVRAWSGTAIVSHEILATASRAHVARALESLSTGDTQIHVALSARDLVRQIPAEWQENVKHRRTTTYAEFLADLQDPSRQRGVASWFWGVQEVPDILDRWGGDAPARAGAPGHRPAGRLAARPAVAAFRAACSGSTPTSSPSGRGAHQPLARSGRSGRRPPTQRADRRVGAQPPLPRPCARGPGPPGPVPRPALGPALGAAGRVGLGR